MSQKERATALIFKLQEAKNPLSAERQPFWDRLKILLDSI